MFIQVKKKTNKKKTLLLPVVQLKTEKITVKVLLKDPISGSVVMLGFYLIIL